MASEAQKRASAKYDAENTVRVVVKFNKNTDTDLVDWLAGQTNKTAAIKQAIRESIKPR